jgi:hypothetical protein
MQCPNCNVSYDTEKQTKRIWQFCRYSEMKDWKSRYCNNCSRYDYGEEYGSPCHIEEKMSMSSLFWETTEPPDELIETGYSYPYHCLSFNPNYEGHPDQKDILRYLLQNKGIEWYKENVLPVIKKAKYRAYYNIHEEATP